MKANLDEHGLDPIDIQILNLLQEHCKVPMAKIGSAVGLSAPAVMERIKKLEDSGVITGYAAHLDARKLGRDITAFIGVQVSEPVAIEDVERQIDSSCDVLECHHVTGSYTLLLKVKTANTRTLEELISQVRSVRGVSRTETLVVLSTHVERLQLQLQVPSGTKRKSRRQADRMPVEEGPSGAGETTLRRA
jgi:Lrp/AsnC family leucine-responsive transcriptional regulator